MKQCVKCKETYDDYFNACPTCRETRHINIKLVLDDDGKIIGVPMQ